MAATQQTQQTAMALQQQNGLARQAVLATAIDTWSQISAQTLTGTIPGQVVNIALRNVGLIKKLLVRISFQLAQAAAETLTLQPLGTSNILSNVILTDLSNQQRVNTTGWHLMAVASAKYRWPYGAATGVSGTAGTDCPFGYAVNYTSCQTAPATITTAAAQNVFAFYEIPVAYSDSDLRGAIYANVVNATLNLQMTVNPNLVVASNATDPNSIFCVYKSSTTSNLGTISNFQIQVYQNYLDQIPIDRNSGSPILPLQDLSTAYILNNTTQTGITANSDNPFSYANFRDFLSTTAIYDNAGTLNVGSDINYWAIQSANYTNIQKTDPFTTAFMGRLRERIDFPKGMYYFDHRNKPISTVQYGNMQLILNPSTATAGATVYLGYEMLALINQVTNAGAIAIST